MIARKSDSLRAQEVLDAISETNERIKVFDITEDQFLHANDVRTRALADSLLMCALRVTEEAGKCYVITEGNSWKVKRIRNNRHVRVAKSDSRGKVQGDWVEATARILDAPTAVEQQGKRLAAKYGLVYHLFMLFMKLTQRKRTSVVIEIA